MLMYTTGEEAEQIETQLTIREPRAQDGDTEAEDREATLFDRTVEAFDQYFNPRNNKLHFAVLFCSRSQQSSETNEQYIR